MYGSVMNGLAVKSDSDIDMTLWTQEENRH